jgi:hypothetical protein
MYVHWNYYLALEEDMAKIARYVEPAEGNLSTYSIEFAHLYLATCSEIDVVLKLLCQSLSDRARPENIDGYRETISEKCPRLIHETCAIPRYDIIMAPWKPWGSGENPEWWRQHQDVKHRRSEHFADANLGNVLSALTALHIATVYYYHLRFNDGRMDDAMYTTTSRLQPEADLLKLPREYYYQRLAAPPL